MMKCKALFTMLLYMVLFSSCNSWREVVYFQDLDDVQLHSKLTETNVKIRPGDQLTIMVFGADKYLIMPYNQTLNSVSDNSLGSGGTRETQLPYDVDEEGDIIFPVLGKIHVAGLTTNELRRYLHMRLDSTIKGMTIFVAIENFRINVLGEVEHPGTFEIKNNSCTFLEALARAGDMKLTANRRNVKLIRMENGRMQHFTYDLTKSEILDSRELFLQQNDVIYVPPINNRVEHARSNETAHNWLFSGLNTILTLGTLIVALTR